MLFSCLITNILSSNVTIEMGQTISPVIEEGKNSFYFEDERISGLLQQDRSESCFAGFIDISLGSQFEGFSPELKFGSLKKYIKRHKSIDLSKVEVNVSGEEKKISFQFIEKMNIASFLKRNIFFGFNYTTENHEILIIYLIEVMEGKIIFKSQIYKRKTEVIIGVAVATFTLN